jgi:hypothetical protein
VVDGTALEMRHTCKGIVGSNPTLSAIKKAPRWGLFYGGSGSVNEPMFDKSAAADLGRRAAPIRALARTKTCYEHVFANPTLSVPMF